MHEFLREALEPLLELGFEYICKPLARLFTWPFRLAWQRWRQPRVGRAETIGHRSTPRGRQR